MAKENEISMSEARAFHKSRSRKAKKKDDCELNKNVLPKPTTGWMGAPGKSDVKGIDHPHTKKVKAHKRKGKPVKAHYRTKQPGADCQPPAP